MIAARATGGGGAGDATQAVMATAMAKVATAAASAPEQLKTFAAEAAKGGGSAQTAAASGAVEQAYQASVLPTCNAMQDRYPFLAAATQDAAIPEMQRVFGMGGVVDGFAQGRLAPLIDTSGPVWRWKTDQPVTANLDPQSPEDSPAPRRSATCSPAAFPCASPPWRGAAT
ncbi:hypothetical protein AB5I41_09425 [Sphingomonas sp. MMS24-JH45]